MGYKTLTPEQDRELTKAWLLAKQRRREADEEFNRKCRRYPEPKRQHDILTLLKNLCQSLCRKLRKDVPSESS